MKSNLPIVGTASLILSLLFGCGDNLKGTGLGGPDAASSDAPAPEGTPTVTSNLPANDAMNVPLNGGISATFSIAMDRTTLIAATFTLVAEVGSVPVAGTVTSTNTTIAFVPSTLLTANTSYIASVMPTAKSTLGIALAAPHSWKFHTGTTILPAGVPVDLGTAADFVLLAKSGITNVPTSMVVGDIGVSPITSTAITGFPLTPDVSTEFATTPQVTGRVYAVDYAEPTPTKLTAAISDMELAFTAAAGRAPDVTELGAGMIGTVTLAPGVYKWSSGLLIPTDITLSGSSTDVWIFEIAQDLTLSSGTDVFLAGGAMSKNVFWQVSGQVTVNTGAHIEGNVLSQTAATLDTGASLNGRLLAQTLVTIRGSVIRLPAP
jgi:hypothetical protein